MSSKKTIDTLVKDIYSVLDGKGGWSKAIEDHMLEGLGNTLSSRLNPSERKPTLRLSGMGQPCERKLWYQINKHGDQEILRPNTKFMFMYGDILEEVVLALARAAGHTVQGEQDELYVSGIKGHRDAVIDGITVDVKSASPYSFTKFKTGNLREDDPFGYISQLSSYVLAGRDHEVESHNSLGAFLAINKVSGEICLDMYDLTHEIEGKEEHFEGIKTMVAEETPPERGFDPVPEGKSGNMKLPVNCSYCDYKHTCRPDLRTFLGSRGPLYLTEVHREPRMKEIT